jgi:hypothetical protein
MEGAKETLARGREVTPDYWRIWIQSSVMALEMNVLDDAESFFRRAAEINPRAHFTDLAQRIAARRKASTQPATRGS